MKWKPLPGRIQVLLDQHETVVDKIITQEMGAHTLLSNWQTYSSLLDAQVAGEKRQRVVPGSAKAGGDA